MWYIDRQGGRTGLDHKSWCVEAISSRRNMLAPALYTRQVRYAAFAYVAGVPPREQVDAIQIMMDLESHGSDVS